MKLANYATVALVAFPQLCVGQGSLRTSSKLIQLLDDDKTQALASLDSVFEGLSVGGLGSQPYKRQNNIGKLTVEMNDERPIKKVDNFGEHITVLQEVAATDSSWIEPDDTEMDIIERGVGEMEKDKSENHTKNKTVAVYKTVGNNLSLSDSSEEEFIAIAVLIGGIIAGDQLFNNGEGLKTVQRIAGDVLDEIIEAYSQVFKIYDEVLAFIFQTITQLIYDMLKGGELDKMAKNLLNGGISGFTDTLYNGMKGVTENMDDFRQLGNHTQNISSNIKRMPEADKMSSKMGGFFDTGLIDNLKDGKSLDIMHRMKDKIEKFPEGMSAKEVCENRDFSQTQCSKVGCCYWDNGECSSNMGDDVCSGQGGLGSLFNDTIGDIRDLVRESASGLREAIENYKDGSSGLGSIQFLVSVEAAFGIGVEFEVGISISIDALLYLAENLTLDGFGLGPNDGGGGTKVASAHVGIGFNIGVQGGYDVGLSIALHTSEVDGIDGFGWGFNVEAAAGYAIGGSINWPLPGSHHPNQYVVQVIGAGGKIEISASISYDIILGYYDKDVGFMLARASTAMAELSGHPSLYYSKYSWDNLGDGGVMGMFSPGIQSQWENLGWTKTSWDYRSQRFSETPWTQLNDNQQQIATNLGYKKKTWNAPVNIDAWSTPYPDSYWLNYDWNEMLVFEQKIWNCLGKTQQNWDNHMMKSSFKKWDALSFDEKLCANDVGYNKDRWGVNCENFELDLVTDNYPQETSWILKDENGQDLGSGSTYLVQEDKMTFKMCIDSNKELTFTINDSYGDGICCGVGIGSYKIMYNGHVLKDGGSFEFTESTVFEAERFPTPCPTLLYSITGSSWGDLACWEEKIVKCDLDDAGALIAGNNWKKAEELGWSSGWSTSNGGNWDGEVEHKPCTGRGFEPSEKLDCYQDFNNGCMYD